MGTVILTVFSTILVYVTDTTAASRQGAAKSFIKGVQYRRGQGWKSGRKCHGAYTQ